MYIQGSNNKADRSLGEYWERRFCTWAGRYGKSFTPMQIGREKSAAAYSLNMNKYNVYTLPDITIWTSPGEHHEIKHKAPTSHNSFGLETYRFEALLWFAKETQQDVMYTIHNHKLSGGRLSTVDKIDHWFTQNVLALENNQIGEWGGKSYVNGQLKRVSVLYWDIKLWELLYDYWMKS